MSDPNSTSPDILSDGPGKDILRPGANPIRTDRIRTKFYVFGPDFGFFLSDRILVVFPSDRIGLNFPTGYVSDFVI
jgi:hypothetical protein